MDSQLMFKGVGGNFIGKEEELAFLGLEDKTEKTVTRNKKIVSL